MCFVFISEQTVTCATYSINWLVFINVVESVYSAVRTDSSYKQITFSLYKAIVNMSGSNKIVAESLFV